MNVTIFERKIMGLAAGQARLLTITGRKSDCEFESMRISHQKIALARELANISDEYQNSLNQTKLVYDFYGTGDTGTPLSYDILMRPSALNDYLPTLLTDSMGRVALDSKLAAAAIAAGIPQEGLGTLPSETMRNMFIQALADNEIITQTLATTIMSLPYNQNIGFGGGATVAVQTSKGIYDKFVDYLKSNGSGYIMDQNQFLKLETTNGSDRDATAEVHVVQIDYSITDPSATGYYNRESNKNSEGKTNGISNPSSTTSFDAYKDGTATSMQFTLGDLLGDSKQYYLGYDGVAGEQCPVYGVPLMQEIIFGQFMDWMCEELSILDLGDGYSGKAMEYAQEKLKELLWPEEELASCGGKTGHDYWIEHSTEGDDDIEENSGWDVSQSYDYLNPISTGLTGDSSYDERYQQWVVTDSKDYIGFTIVNSEDSSSWFVKDRNDHAAGGINLNNVAKAFLTYFADYMNGVSATDNEGNEIFEVHKGAIEDKDNPNHLANTNKEFEYIWKIGSDVSSDDLGQATFYDALFNQICSSGWTENASIQDKEYLQYMLQNGMLYISKMKDDGYYYQGNYATDTYIKEVADETLIAAAEAKYNTQKAKLNMKEQTLDLRLKNLDTEISALTTEYDTVKNTISKQIEKTFKRYNA